MSKPILNVLVNPNVNLKLYIEFLSEKYDVKIINYSQDISININDIHLVLFTGGEDVNPKFYNEKVGKYTKINSDRDTLERNMYNYAISRPKLGICRGAQFLTVMNGGKLIQHVQGHGVDHNVEVNIQNTYLPDEFKNFKVTSTHHQMMFPYILKKDEYNILAYSSNYLSNTYLNGANTETYINNINFYECEIIKYYKTNSLCIQGHPEFKDASATFKAISHYLIQTIL